MGSLKRLNMSPQVFSEGDPTLCGAHGWIPLIQIKNHPESFPVYLKRSFSSERCHLWQSAWHGRLRWSQCINYVCTDVPYSCVSSLPQFRRLDFCFWEIYFHCLQSSRAEWPCSGVMQSSLLEVRPVSTSCLVDAILHHPWAIFSAHSGAITAIPCSGMSPFTVIFPQGTKKKKSYKKKWKVAPGCLALLQFAWVFIVIERKSWKGHTHRLVLKVSAWWPLSCWKPL